MIQQAVILSVKKDKKEAIVSPLITGACLSCKEGCAQRGTPFTVKNSKDLDIKEGNVVSISASKKAEGIQSVISLLLPAACAFAAFFASAPLSLALWQAPASEGFKAACVLAGILIPGTAVLALSRFKIRPSTPFIDKVF